MSRVACIAVAFVFAVGLFGTHEGGLIEGIQNILVGRDAPDYEYPNPYPYPEQHPGGERHYRGY